jgi:hypothetical protein
MMELLKRLGVGLIFWPVYLSVMACDAAVLAAYRMRLWFSRRMAWSKAIWAGFLGAVRSLRGR